MTLEFHKTPSSLRDNCTLDFVNVGAQVNHNGVVYVRRRFGRQFTDGLKEPAVSLSKLVNAVPRHKEGHFGKDRRLLRVIGYFERAASVTRQVIFELTSFQNEYVSFCKRSLDHVEPANNLRH